MLLFDGQYDGNFVFHMRRWDDRRKMVVLRGSTMLASMAWSVHQGVVPHVHNVQDVYHLLDDYAIQYIIVENKVVEDVEAFRLLRDPVFTKVISDSAQARPRPTCRQS